jgi:enamine deaminase RidA (YjgF/YER057c/UK114 family)
MYSTALLITLSGLAIGLSNSPSIAQSQPNFEKKNFSYNEWTKGKFSEVVTVTNPGKFIFLAGIGPEREGDGKIVHEGNFMEQCKYAYMKIKKLLELQGATMNDVVRIMTYTTDVRFFQDALKCRGEAFGDAPIPASTFLVVSCGSRHSCSRTDPTARYSGCALVASEDPSKTRACGDRAVA